MARRISVVNQKGGVGKTTTAVNLGVALAMRGFRVLLVDYDPQANASNFLGLVARLEHLRLFTAADLTLGLGRFQPLTDVLLPGLDLVPATDVLASVESRHGPNGSRLLKRALDRVAHRYDFILADCAPTLGMLAVNAMVACPGARPRAARAREHTRCATDARNRRVAEAHRESGSPSARRTRHVPEGDGGHGSQRL